MLCNDNSQNRDLLCTSSLLYQDRKSSYGHFNMNLTICTNCAYISLYYVAHKLSILEQQEIVSIK